MSKKYMKKMICYLISIILLSVLSCDSGSGGDSTINFGLPGAPENVTALKDDESVLLSWKPVSGASGYNVYWSEAPGVTITDNVIINASSLFKHEGLSNYNTYYYAVSAVNIQGESDLSAEVSATPAVLYTDMIEKLMSGEEQVNDFFGYSVSISGDYAIVGALYAEAAYIYHRTGEDTWDSGTKITANDAQPGDGFGEFVSISGDYAIVGARNEDGGDGNPYSNAGAAYIFHRTGENTWDSGIKIVADEVPTASDNFGYSVSISGDYAIVGVYGEDGGPGNPITNAGAAYIFHRTGENSWDSGTKITANDAQTGDSFGISVSISGDYAIAGANFENGGPGDPIHFAGAAYIFHRTGVNSWDSGFKLMAYDAQADDIFGNSVSISGDYAIVGATGEDGGTGDPLIFTGAAYIFRRTGENTWDMGVKIIAPDQSPNDNFGSSVSISGNYAFVGVPNKYRIVGEYISYAGTAYLFTRTGPNSWSNCTRLLVPGMQYLDYFGGSVAISGDYVIIGAPGVDDPVSNAGTAYIYKR